MWEVIGYVASKTEKGDITSYTLHCKRPLKSTDGSGEKTRTVWFRPIIDYKPCIGDRIIIDEEKRGQYMVVTDIVVI